MAVNLDTLHNLFRRLSTGADSSIEVLIELLLIGFCVNWVAGVLHGTRGTRLLRGLLVLLITVTLFVRILAGALDWARLDLLYQYFLIGLAFISLVAFQPELRRALIRAGDVRFLRRTTPREKLIAALIEASGYLSRNKFGALVAIQREIGLANWTENGTQINAEISADLLKSIFFPNSAMHDLGVIVRGTKVVAASCQFPVAESGEVIGGLGSRHRAAVGLSSESDALVLIVSEETGTISLADRGELTRFLSLDDLEEELQTRLSGAASRPRRRAIHKLSDVWRYSRRMLVVAPLTLVIWFLADQATLRQADGIEVLLGIQPEAGFVLSEECSEPVSLRVGVRGPTRSIEKLRSDASDTPLLATWPLPAPYQRAGRFVLESEGLQDILEALPTLASYNVIVESVSPDRLSFEIDRVQNLNLPVRVDAGAVRVADVVVEPAEVQVAMRSQDLQRIPDAARQIVAALGERVTDLTPGETRSFSDVKLDIRIGAAQVLSLRPASVNVTLRVVAQQVTRTLEQKIPVQLLVSPQVAERINPVRRDVNEWLIEIEVTGDQALVDALDPTDVLAYVEIGAIDAVPSDQFRPYEVQVRLPEGLRLSSAPATVYLRPAPREATP